MPQRNKLLKSVVYYHTKNPNFSFIPFWKFFISQIFGYFFFPFISLAEKHLLPFLFLIERKSIFSSLSNPNFEREELQELANRFQKKFSLDSKKFRINLNFFSRSLTSTRWIKQLSYFCRENFWISFLATKSKTFQNFILNKRTFFLW